MSESENYEEVTVTSDGITVIKTYEDDAFPVPAIAFRIHSERSEPVSVRLVDDVPEDVPVEDLGFHPEYGSEYWTIEDDEITFEREIEADEEYTTVYGIRATGTENAGQFLTEPALAEVDPPLEDDSLVGESSSDVVRDVISGNTDSIPGLADEDDEPEDIEELELSEPEDEADATAAVEADTAEATDGSGAVAMESVASALAAEIRNGDVAEEDLELLREELDIGSGGGEGGPMEARVEKLQTDVSDLEAYIDALEEFLEENGTGEDIITDVQDDVESFRSRLDDVEDTSESTADRVSGFEDSMDELGEDLQALKGDVKDIEGELDGIRATVEDIESDIEEVDDLEERIDDAVDAVEELENWREQLSNVLGAAGED